MRYSRTLSLDCPYCNTRTQFVSDMSKVSLCKNEDLFHDLFTCTNCFGCIITKWSKGNKVNSVVFQQAAVADLNVNLKKYYPVVGDFLSQVETVKIEDELVKKDYEEAVDCYNNGFYNASMVMSRRAIHQEMDYRNIEGENLYQKINSLDISSKLKKLLQKVKNFGNSGAHPDYFLYDNDNNKLIAEENEKKFAKLSLIFLDKYFQDQYEIGDLINSAPNSAKENKDIK